MYPQEVVNHITCFPGQHLAGWSGCASAATTYITLLNAKIEANARIQVSPLPGQGPHPQLAEQETLFTPPWGQQDDVTQPWEESTPHTWQEQQPAWSRHVLGDGWRRLEMLQVKDTLAPGPLASLRL